MIPFFGISDISKGQPWIVAKSFYSTTCLAPYSCAGSPTSVLQRCGTRVGVVVQWVKLPVVCLCPKMECLVQIPTTLFSIQFPPHVYGRLLLMAQTLGPLQPVRETQMEFLASALAWPSTTVGFWGMNQ